jgi:hypothetical protein
MNYEARHIRDRYPSQVTAVRRALQEAFSTVLRESEDFERDAVLFRTPNGGLVTVSEEFLSDFSVISITQKLTDWDVAALARRLARLERLVVTTEGTFTENS